jgi:hypothetical protein
LTPHQIHKFYDELRKEILEAWYDNIL